MRLFVPAAVLLFTLSGCGDEKPPPGSPVVHQGPALAGAPSLSIGHGRRPRLPDAGPDPMPLPPEGGSGGGGEGGAGGAGGTGGTGGVGGDPAGGSGGSDVPPNTIHFTEKPVSLGGDRAIETPLFYTGMGGGVGMLDLDGDGDLDLVFTAEQEHVRAYRNLGNFQFEEPAGDFGLGEIMFSAAMAAGDCDGDGYPELFFSRSETGLLYGRDMTDGLWRRREGSKLDLESGHGLSAEFADLDGDGDLDLVQTIYSANESVNGYKGERPRAFFNDGACHFEERDLGFVPAMGVDLGLFDADGDGDPDLLVSADFGMIVEPTDYYENLGGGVFWQPPAPRGIHDPFYGMGVGVGDLDQDGRLDAVVANIGRNPWYRNDGDNVFPDASDRMPTMGSSWYLDQNDEPMSFPIFDPNSEDESERRLAAYVKRYIGPRPEDAHSYIATSWGASVQDLDADGWMDVFITRGRVGAGMVPEGRHQRLGIYRGYRRQWTDVSPDAGVDIAGTFKGHAVGDLNGDGLPDVVVFDHLFANPKPQHRVFANTSDHGNWLRVRPLGKGANTAAIGAMVKVILDENRTITIPRSFHSGVYSTCTDAIFVGLGKARVVDVEVTWPWGGGTTLVKDVTANQTLAITQP